MKITAKDIPGILKSQDPRFLLYLFYGQDQGLARERSTAIGRAFAENLDDPFVVARLSGTQLEIDPALLQDEMNALPPFGGIKIVMVTGAGSDMVAAVKNCITALNPEARLIIRATDVNKRHALVGLCDREPSCASIGCYPDNDRNIAELAREAFALDNITVEPTAMSIIMSRLGSDRQASRSELEKLALLAGPRGTLTQEDVEDALGDNAALMLDQLSIALLTGDITAFEAHHARAINGGTQPVVIVRHVLRIFKTLTMIQAFMQKGEGVTNAVAKIRPPIHFMLKPSITKTASNLSFHQSRDIIDRLVALEIQIKSISFQNASMLVGQGLLGLCLRTRAKVR